MSSAAIFSDIHLLNTPTEDHDLFLRTLKNLEINNSVSEVWLIGDIFDCLVGDQNFWISKHQEFWNQLHRFANAGKKVLYFEGNHDFGFKKIALQHGVQAYTEGRCHLFQGHRVFLSHGDELDTDNETYARWRKFTKSSRVRAIYRSVPHSITQKFLVPFAETYSGFRKKKRDPAQIEYELSHYREKYLEFAKSLVDEKSYHAVFLGHSHIKEFSTFGSSAFYCNLGSWLGNEKPYALWNPEQDKYPKILMANKQL